MTGRTADLINDFLPAGTDIQYPRACDRGPARVGRSGIGPEAKSGILMPGWSNPHISRVSYGWRFLQTKPAAVVTTARDLFGGRCSHRDSPGGWTGRCLAVFSMTVTLCALRRLGKLCERLAFNLRVFWLGAVGPHSCQAQKHTS